MTRDEIRGLIGGYATGSLSAAERKALFDAALDDQELFDELAGEQALKELLDEPGVKARLMTALAPRRTPPRHAQWWSRTNLNRAWLWAAAGAVATVIIVGIVLLEKPREREIAQVIAPPPVREQPVPGQAVAPAAPPEVGKVVPAPAASKLDVSKGVVAGEVRPVAPAPAAQPGPPPPAPAADAISVASLQKTEAAPAAAPVAAPAAPANAPAAAAAGTPANEAFAVSGTVTAGLQGAQAGRGGGGGGGRGGGRGGAARAAPQPPVALRAAAPRFAFDYRLTPDGVLRVQPASDGFLSVEINKGTGFTALFSGRQVVAGSMNEVMLPADAASVAIIFANQATSPEGGLIPDAVDPPAGTKLDPNPSPNSRLVAVIPVNSAR